MEQIIRIRDIELGKPDAKDEALYSESLETFCERLIIPPNFDITNLVNKDKCYIIGNKGVGKTALLFYIHNLLLQDNPDSVCSMILFKTDVDMIQRAGMDKVEKIRISELNIGNELDYVKDFTNLWKLVIYKKIIQDNKEFDIFEKNTNWNSFETLITQLDNHKLDVLRLADQIPAKGVCYDSNQNHYVIDKVPYPNDESSYALDKFYEAIKFADKLLCSLSINKPKYYICIDELEVYNSNHNIYIRDLTMIRDLIITTKRINAMLKSSKIDNIKIILSVRSEVVNSIMREVPGWEYNKDLGGFAEKICWTSGSLVDFVYHPLTSIWLKRIQKSLSQSGDNYSASYIYKNMFPNIIGIDDTAKYVVERTWQKPRDIIRLMSCINSEVDQQAYYYDEKCFVRAMAEYSRQSREELVEELGAIYSSTEIEKIFNCLTAYKKVISRDELKQRITERVISFYPQLDASKIIDDLYRFGIIGLINSNTLTELWGYLGQSVIEDTKWQYLVHRGLWRELKLEQETYEGIYCIDIVGLSHECKVEKKEGCCFIVSFKYADKKLKGLIHAKNVTGSYIDMDEYVEKTINAFVVGYDTRKKLWQLSKISKRNLWYLW